MPRSVPVAVAVAVMPPVPSHAPPTPLEANPLPTAPARAHSPAPAAQSLEAARVPEGEAWRWQLSRGDAIDIRSSTAGAWVAGHITKMDRDRVKVEYVVAKELCDKVLLLTSPDLRPAGSVVGGKPPTSAPTALPSKAPTATSPPGSAVTTPNQVVRQVAATPATPPRPLLSAASPARSTPATPLQVARQASAGRIPNPQSSCGPAWRKWVDVQVASPAATPAQTPVQTPLQTPHTASSPSSASSQCLRFTSNEWLKLADLQIEELLGSGGFGAVHRGKLHGEEVAIKRLHLSDGQISKEHLAEFQKEVANLQALRHPRLIRFIGVALELPVMCIVTELASGGSLYALLHVQHMPLSEVHRRFLVLEICEGVAFLHGRRPPCVHRDLKSANVVLDADLHAKLCDFGLAETMEKTHISRRESEAGSPRYMAPEVFDARSKLTEKLDVWALGCLIAEVLIDQVPHEDCSTIQQVAAKLLVKNLGPFEDEWADGLRPEVRQLVGGCFAREAPQRPSAMALLEGLRCLDGLSLPKAVKAPKSSGNSELMGGTAAAAGTTTVPPTMLVHCVH